MDPWGTPPSRPFQLTLSSSPLWKSNKQNQWWAPSFPPNIDWLIKYHGQPHQMLLIGLHHPTLAEDHKTRPIFLFQSWNSALCYHNETGQEQIHHLEMHTITLPPPVQSPCHKVRDWTQVNNSSLPSYSKSNCSFFQLFSPPSCS